VSTGSVDEVLLTGKAGRKTLTLFQSVGLIVAGLAVALGVGASLLIIEVGQEKTFDRNYGELFVGGVFALWGVAMMIFGLVGIAKIASKKNCL